MGKEATHMLNNHARLVYFFDIAENVKGRKKLQKLIYILQKCRVPFKEKFQFHFYGPYSEELTLRVEELCNLHLIQESKEDKGNYSRYNYSITEEGKSFLDQFALDMPDFLPHIELLQDRSSRFLELVSTMLFFATELEPVEVEEKVNKVKPKQKFTEAEFADAWELIEKLNTMPLS